MNVYIHTYEARAGFSALGFFLLTFPAVGIAFKNIWKGRAPIWPLIVYAASLSVDRCAGLMFM